MQWQRKSILSVFCSHEQWQIVYFKVRIPVAANKGKCKVHFKTNASWEEKSAHILGILRLCFKVTKMKIAVKVIELKK